MTENTNKTIAVAEVAKTYKLDINEFSEMLELIGAVTANQRKKIIMCSAALAMANVMENKAKAT